MKNFLVKLAILVGGLLLVFSTLSKLVDPYIYGGYQDSVADLKQQRPEVILLGDSHAWALKQKYFQNRVLNFSFDSDSLFDMYCKLRFCIEEGIPLKRVLLECDMHIFAEYRLRANNRKRIAVFASYSQYKDSYQTSLPDYLVNRKVYPNLSALDINNARLLIKVIKEKATSFVVDEPSGATSHFTEWADRSPQNRRQLAASRFEDQFRDPFAPQFVAVFDNILALCRQNGIEVIGVKFPVATEYQEMIENADLQEVKKVFADSGIRIIDLSSGFSDPELFFNQDHLNERGSEEFCTRLLAELDRLEAIQSK